MAKHVLKPFELNANHRCSSCKTNTVRVSQKWPALLMSTSVIVFVRIRCSAFVGKWLERPAVGRDDKSNWAFQLFRKNPSR